MSRPNEVAGRIKEYASPMAERAEELAPFIAFLDPIIGKCAQCMHRFYCFRYMLEALDVTGDKILMALAKTMDNCDEMKKGKMRWHMII